MVGHISNQDLRKYMKTFNEFDNLKSICIAKEFPNKKFIGLSVVGNTVDKAFAMAWEDAHSDGEVMVEQKFADLADLIRPFID